jgi:hypothetical protein
MLMGYGLAVHLKTHVDGVDLQGHPDNIEVTIEVV